MGVIQIAGSGFSDERGKLNFFNSFSMKEILRFYEIAPASTDIIRAWQGHQREKKWFYCHTGEFIVNLIKISNFENPKSNLKAERFQINAANPKVLEVPGGYASGFRASQKGSKLMVFSNFTLSESQEDDFRYPWDQWSANW